jgi:hypothetical protein
MVSNLPRLPCFSSLLFCSGSEDEKDGSKRQQHKPSKARALAMEMIAGDLYLACAHACVCVCVFVCVRLCMCEYVCVYVCECVRVR